MREPVPDSYYTVIFYNKSYTVTRLHAVGSRSVSPTCWYSLAGTVFVPRAYTYSLIHVAYRSQQEYRKRVRFNHLDSTSYSAKERLKAKRHPQTLEQKRARHVRAILKLTYLIATTYY
eukprot:scaffold323264_cov35-Attheya_sp.AAC.1